MARRCAAAGGRGHPGGCSKERGGSEEYRALLHPVWSRQHHDHAPLPLPPHLHRSAASPPWLQLLSCDALYRPPVLRHSPTASPCRVCPVPPRCARQQETRRGDVRRDPEGDDRGQPAAAEHPQQPTQRTQPLNRTAHSPAVRGERGTGLWRSRSSEEEESQPEWSRQMGCV